MQVTDVLEFASDDLDALDRPVMLVGLEGWFDVAGAATHAVSAFTYDETSVVVGSIDPDVFYDFTQQRPQVSIEDGIRRIVWPGNDFCVRRNPGHRDVVGLIGVEPHLYWKTYVDAVITVATALGCEAIVTVGASAEAIPHTRVPPVNGSTATPDLAHRLGLVAPSYEGVTGIAGVPPLWNQLAGLEWPAEAAESVRYFTNTGGHMPRATLDRLRRAMPNASPLTGGRSPCVASVAAIEGCGRSEKGRSPWTRAQQVMAAE